MSQGDSLTVLFGRLREWAKFPNYQLERRIDIFLTPFLAAFLSDRLEAQVSLVAPEFPIKHVDSNQSVKIDYLLRRDGRDPAWIFLELKTDARSMGDDQPEHYRRARASGMTALLADLGAIYAATLKVHRPKYDLLRDTIAKSGPTIDKIELAYLSPAPPGDDIRWFPLADFRAWQPREHRELWSEVVELLATLEHTAA